MSHRHDFNATASEGYELAHGIRPELTSSASGANSGIVDAMHEAIGLRQSDPKVSARKEHEETQAEFRDQAAASSGDSSVLAGRIASGVAASAISDNHSVSQEEKKKKEQARFLNTLLAMRADLDRRIGELDRQYEDLMQEAQEHFDKANEMDDLANKIEDGTATPEEIERARKLLGKDKNAPIDKEDWTAKLREGRDIQNRFGLDKAEEAQKVRERADRFRQERAELDKDIDRIQAVPEAERPAAAKQAVESKEAVDFEAGKPKATADVQEHIDQAAETNELEDSSFNEDELDDEFADMSMPVPPPTTGIG